jgi:hypothetical protein
MSAASWRRLLARVVEHHGELHGGLSFSSR